MSFKNFVSSRNNKRLVFEIHDIDLSIVNAIRRVILSEIPNVAIAFDSYHPEENDITIHKNTTALHNEIMGHRISLIPIHVDPNHVDDFDYRFEIDVTNETSDVVLLTTDDIKVYNSQGEHKPKLTKTFFPHDDITGDPILITKLKPNNYNTSQGESFHAEFKARAGIAKKHARWSPVSTCTYVNIVDETAANKVYQEILKESANLPDDEVRKIINRFNTLDRQRHFIKNELDEPSAFRFTIETECKLSPSYLFTKAIDILIAKLDAFPSKLDIHNIHEEQQLYLVKVTDEDHTMGNMFQSLCYNMHVHQSKDLDFIGYFQPHPLENDIVFKIKFAKNQNPKDFLAQAAQTMAANLSGIRTKWLQASN